MSITDFEDFEDAEALNKRLNKIDTSLKPFHKFGEQKFKEKEFGEILTTEDLKEQVMYLHKLENEYDILSKKTKEYGNSKRKLRSKIAYYMNNNDLEVLRLKEGPVYSLSKSTTTVNPLTAKRLPINLTKWFSENGGLTTEGAEKKTGEIIEFIKGNAEKVQKVVLRKSNK